MTTEQRQQDDKERFHKLSLATCSESA
jgi:hypothetical protein